MVGYQYISSSDTTQRPGHGDPVHDTIEEFDPSLARLNTINKLASYCDSLYSAQVKKSGVVSFSTFAEIANHVIRKRFYHGYSYYGADKNFMASVISKVSEPGLRAIVIPNDILAYQYAACSQQSIILMELLKEKGIATRKVGFTGNITGHFTIEAYYDHDWHYFDPDKEPDEKVLAAYNYPSIAYLNSNPEILLKAYPNYTKDYVMDVFTKYSYGSVNTFPAPRAIIFQKISKFLSYTLWSFFLLAFIWVRRKYKALNNPVAVRKSSKRIAVHTPAPVSSVYSPA
jgi:hypothetical protein